jgi:hypothetical protein
VITGAEGKLDPNRTTGKLSVGLFQFITLVGGSCRCKLERNIIFM